MHLRTYYPTVVLSDIHLGTSHSKTIEVSNFLKSVNCDRLILNGDIMMVGICARQVLRSGKQNILISLRLS